MGAGAQSNWCLRIACVHQGKSGGERWAPSQTGVCVLHAYIKGSQEVSGGRRRPVKLVSAYCMRTSREVRR